MSRFIELFKDDDVSKVTDFREIEEVEFNKHLGTTSFIQNKVNYFEFCGDSYANNNDYKKHINKIAELLLGDEILTDKHRIKKGEL